MYKKMGLSAFLAAVYLSAAASFCSCGGADTVSVIDKVEEGKYINVYGRTFYNENLEGTTIINSASGFEVRFTGTSLKAEVWASVSGTGYTKSMFSVFIDGETDCTKNIISIKPTSGLFFEVVLVSDLPEGEHTVKILKRTSSNRDRCVFKNIQTDGHFLEAPDHPSLKLDFYGDSITCGEGILRNVTYNEATGKYDDDNVYTSETYNVLQSYAGVAAKELNAEFRVFGRGGISMNYPYGSEPYTVLSNYKSMAVDLSVEKGECPEYDYSTYTPDVVVIYLGTNDYNWGRKFPSLNFTMSGLKNAFVQFINEVIGTYYGKDMPVIICSGMLYPDSGLVECMESVKDTLKAEYPNLETLQFDEIKTGHPVVDEGEAAGKVLAAKITAMLNK